MSETKFTKNMVLGSSTDEAPICVDGFCNVDGKRFEVCAVWGVDDDSVLCDQSKANARLIAAAPEMYEMLRRFLPRVTYGENGEEIFHGGDFEWYEDDDPMIDELKALLAKARGES